MQINGAHLATVFAPKPLELQEQTRKPVTIDASSSFKVEDEPSSRVNSGRPSTQADIRANDSQQSRFVRFFATNDELSTSTKGPSQQLPQGVQQYIQVADLQGAPPEATIDEIV